MIFFVILWEISRFLLAFIYFYVILWEISRILWEIVGFYVILSEISRFLWDFMWFYGKFRDFMRFFGNFTELSIIFLKFYYWRVEIPEIQDSQKNKTLSGEIFKKSAAGRIRKINWSLSINKFTTFRGLDGKKTRDRPHTLPCEE